MNQKKRVIALGFFDGVHNGHAALMRRTAQVAKEIGAVPSAFTFDPHPQTVITGKPLPLITSPEDRTDLMRKYYGIEDVIVQPFTPEFRQQPWRKFLEETLIRDCGAVHLVAGHDYHFGFKGEGNPQKLQEACKELGVGCDIIEKVELDSIRFPPPISGSLSPPATLSGPTCSWATPIPSATGSPTAKSWGPPWDSPR